MAIVQPQLGTGAGAVCESHLVVYLLLNAGIDLVETHVAVHHQQEVILPGEQRPVPTGAGQELHCLRIVDVQKHVLLVQTPLQRPDELAQVHILSAFQLGQHPVQDDAHEILAVRPPIALMPLGDGPCALRCLPGGLHELQHVPAGHCLVEALQVQRLQRTDQPLQRRQVGGDHAIHRYPLIECVETGHDLGGCGEIGRPVGIPKHQDIGLHVLEQRGGGRGMRLASVEYRVAVPEAQFRDTALVETQQPHAADEAPRGSQFVVVLGHDQIGPWLLGAQQAGGQPGGLHRQTQQWQIAIQSFHQGPHLG